MDDPIAFGGVVVTVFFLVLSLRAQRWWPPFYVLAVLSGFSTGVLGAGWDEPMRSLWWVGWFIYVWALPIGRIEAARRDRADQRAAQRSNVLREACSVDSDEQYIYIRNARGEVIDKVARTDSARVGA